MIVVAIFFCVSGSYLLFKSVVFLYSYLKFFRNEVRTEGVLISLQTYKNNLFLKGASIPIVQFKTKEGLIIKASPIHSYFVEIFNYRLNNSYSLFYKESRPEQFIIKNKTEVVANTVMSILIVCGLFWAINFLISL